MSDHQRYEELAALSAAGLLSDGEVKELREHSQTCLECRGTEKEFAEIFRSGLPLTANPVGEFLRQRKVDVDEGMRDRFLARVRNEGVALSPEVSRAVPGRSNYGVFAAAMTAAAVLLIVFFGPGIYQRATGAANSQQTIAQLEQQNASLNQNVAQLNQALAAQQSELQKLQAKLGIAAKTTESLREENAHERTEVQQASSQTVQFPAELANRDKQLQDARSELERINKLHFDDEASLVAQQVRIAELSDQLRVASATLDMERQLTAAGKDIRELLAARQLHVIDVRDIDANGKPGRAFGRVFVAEGKTLTFYAFDLDEGRPLDAKRRFEVWGSEAKGGAPKRLGFFNVDSKAQQRWALKVNDSHLIGEVSSVFVTVESSGNPAAPSGQPLLYANLGRPNHP